MASKPFRKCLQKNVEKCKNSQKVTKNGQKWLKIPLGSAYRNNVEKCKNGQKMTKNCPK